MPDEDRAYFYHRAEVQMDLAERADHAAAINAHVALAEHYLDLCDPERLLAEARAGHDGLTPVGSA
ncbi:hypothetical protein M9980_05425 [Sphingomonas donggukensis]|uniref:Uncharacterized protein n=1 Tax=Sphingomonas donggukensis TaxID=2949093 RepID=A0ABY4TYC5_9SPHN|nr:hypothetical protein [Sphingomonas donggukensis]URW76651.1 hypothetical protein M9980_05425 [Sphingomonas donggukensis]